MSTHSYSRIWIHLIWETLAREPMLHKKAAAKASIHLSDYSLQKGIYMKINYFNADHTHTLIDLPTGKCIEEVVQLFKDDSSHWINENKLVRGRFAWGRGYGAFSVSHSEVGRVAAYIAGQEKHHKRKTFADEFELLLNGMGWNGATRQTVKTVQERAEIIHTRLKPGVNERRPINHSDFFPIGNLSVDDGQDHFTINV